MTGPASPSPAIQYPHFMRWILLTFGTLSSFAAGQTAPTLRGQDSFEKQVKPLLEQYCFDCHSDGVNKGKFAMDEHPNYAALAADMKYWDHVRQMLNTHVMPPVNKDAPTLEQRDTLVKWIDDNIFWFDPANPDPGHVVMRRLNRNQYNNTVRDLLFLYDVRAAQEFPPDDTGYGYDNIGAVLSLSPMLMEKYLRASRKVADAAIKITAPEKASIEVGAAKFEKKKGVEFDGEGQGVLWFFSSAESKTNFQLPSEGTYRIRIQTSATQVGTEKAKIAVGIDGKRLGEYEVTSQWQEKDTPWQTIEIETPLSPGTRKLSVAFLNDHVDESAPEHHRDRNVAIDKITVEGPIGLTPPRPSKFLQWLAPGVAFGLPAIELSGEDFSPGQGKATRDTGTIYLAANGYVTHPLEIREPGKYQFTLKAGALQAGDEPAKWEVRLDDKVIKSGSVTAKNQAPQWFNFEAEVQPGKHEIRVAFLNDFYDEQTKADRNLWVHEVKVQGPLTAAKSIDPKDLPALVTKMGDRLFRRPMTAEEKTKWTAFAEQALATGEDPRGVIGYLVEGMVAAPAFLFHTQPVPAGSRLGKTELIDETTLASRLSYFLWSAPPDDRLLQLAAKGELRKNLKAEVIRMIGDWRAAAMTDNFAGQWLQLRDVDLVAPNRRQFPEFEGGIGSAMKRESEMFFDFIFRGNRSVIEFLNADYTFVNRKLAQYYNLPDADKIKPKDKSGFEKVSLAGTPRGGLLTQGGVLVLTSNPTRTNIVRRGAFILDKLLGMTPPPAPGDIPPLDEKEARFGKLTLRQQFEAHRADTGCAGCHALLDPIGFALENYDAVGRWRDQDHKLPVDSSGQLIRGQQFKNFQELRDIMVRDMKTDFVRCLAENLLTFSMGRGLSYADRPAVHEVVKRAEANGYQFHEIILAVTESVPFQRMRLD